MKSKILTTLVLAAIIGVLIVPVVTQGAAGKVLIKRTGQTYPTISAALAHALNTDILVVAGKIVETNTIVFNGLSVQVIGLGSIFAPTITAPCDVFDVSGRGSGGVVLSGLTIVVPTGDCAGVYSDSDSGNPIVLKNLKINGAKGATDVSGIYFLDDAGGGPYTITNNTIAGDLCVGIVLAGFATDVTATITGNKIVNTGSSCHAVGIYVEAIGTGSTVLVQKNNIDGGGFANDGFAGILVSGSEAGAGITVTHNTAKNFASYGFVVDGSPAVKMTANWAKNNQTAGFGVDLFCDDSVTSPVITGNNITCSDVASAACGFVGVDFASPCVTPPSYNLNATNNWWGSRDGPADFHAGSNCGGVSVCGTASGTGLKVKTDGTDDCGGGVGQVQTCPDMILGQNFGAGAGS